MNKIRHTVVLFSLFFALFACVSFQERGGESLFQQRHYTFTILHDLEMPNGPQLDIALTLLEINLPEHQTRFLHNVLYLHDTPEEFKDRIIRDQRKLFREKEVSADSRWKYSERLSVISARKEVISVKRKVETFSGEGLSRAITRYYVLDLSRLRKITVDDLFGDFQGDDIRAAIYAELRRHHNISPDQSLTKGGFFSNEPELSFNFFLTSAGLGLNWDPSAIAPQSLGAIEIIVPWREIRPFMIRNGIELLTKFGIYLFAG